MEPSPRASDVHLTENFFKILALLLLIVFKDKLLIYLYFALPLVLYQDKK